MTDEQIVKVLAEREGYSDLKLSVDGGFVRGFGIPPGESEPPRTTLPFYLTSHDALAGVLGKLTVEEWRKLHTQLQTDADYDSSRSFGYTKFLLTLPPRVLAEAVAGVVEKGKV